MAVTATFSSGYKALAHGALNWDGPLDTDMGSLETNLAQSTWTPGLGGTGATTGTSGGSSGYVCRLFNKQFYSGRILLGSTPSLGSGTPAVTSVNAQGMTLDTNLSFGTGWYLRASGGQPVPLLLTPLTASTFALRAVQAGTSALLNTVVTAPAQSDEIRFEIFGIGA